jgi:hypothetical protein
MNLDPSRLKKVQLGDYVSAEQWNILVDLLSRDTTGPGTVRTPAGRQQRDTPVIPALSWVIVREIIDDNDIKVRVEKAVRGPNFAVPGDDYGRYVGAFEYARTPEMTVEDQVDYIEEMLIEPGRIAGEYKTYLWPFADEPGGWGDVDRDQTDILLAIQVDGAWSVLMTPTRLYSRVTTLASAQGDCTPEGE